MQFYMPNKIVSYKLLTADLGETSFLIFFHCVINMELVLHIVYGSNSISRK